MKIHIIGAGGVTGYAMPAINRTYGRVSITEGLHGNDIVIQDGDTLEERNLDRQLFDAKCVGRNKADALNRTHRTRHKIEPRYYSGEVLDADFILCAADNNICRMRIMSMMDDTSSKATLIVAGNERNDAIAFVYRTAWRGTELDPRVRYPEMPDDKEGDPTAHCTSPEVLAVAPQTATANMRAAGLMLWLLGAWFDFSGEESGMPYESFQTKYNTTTKRKF